MPNYSVQYKYERLDSDVTPDKQKYGFGVIVLNTERAPESIEDFREMARTIGTLRTATKTEDYKSVDILAYGETDEEITHTTSSDEVLEGTIV